MWRPTPAITNEIRSLIVRYRFAAERNLLPLVTTYCPSLLQAAAGAEYRKLIELTTKMQMVGHACTEIAGFDFDSRRTRIACLFGACCFLGDGFLDDYGETASRDYVRRFHTLLTRGWFDVETERERVFYIVVSRLFSSRDVFRPMLRQAVCRLFEVQRLDVELSLGYEQLRKITRKRKLALLRNCARDRSGHAITALTLFLVPEAPLMNHHLLYRAGALIAQIDDFGDYYFDVELKKMTYINQVKRPRKRLAEYFNQTIDVLNRGLADSHGRELLKGFLHRYFITRLAKHESERRSKKRTLPVYE
jgi:hypothetical protein